MYTGLVLKYMPDLEEIQKQLASLRVEFASNLVQRVDQMITDLNSLEGQADPFGSLQDIYRQIHSLSGSAGTFGFNRLSEQSRQLELILKEFINNHSFLDAETTEYLTSSLQKLHNLIDKGPDDDHSSDIQLESLPTQRKTERQVYVVEGEPAQGRKLYLQLNHYGLKTRVFSTTTEAKLALEQEVPDALVLDIVPPEGLSAATDLVTSIRHLLKEPIPSLFISSRKDWESRLAAVRAGGTAYLDKPVDVSMLVDHLHRITQRVQREPYRVLVVDDAFELARHYTLVLRQAGMHAELLTEPSCILEKSDDFNPELILLDFYFPGVSGMEIAQVLRQHQTHFSTPIIFLSTETDLDTQLKTLQQGDDFLEKPILDTHLVSRVELRIERARALSKLMYHDRLTGLLNQITLKRCLEIELAHCQRQGSPLSYIMLDLDHFKQVNDSHGHAAGERVLKSLAHLLRERLRKSDQIGRNGGEKFGIILPDTDPDKAYQIIEDLRKRFAQLTYWSDGGEFTCSFSAGIACMSAFGTEERLIEAADEALYLAKEKGRNLIILHKECN